MTLNFAGNPALAPFIVLKQKKTLMCTSFTTQLKDSCWRETSTWLKRGGCHLLHCQRCLEIPWSFLKCAHVGANSLGLGSFKDIIGVWRGYRPMLCFMSFLCLMQLLESKFPAVPFIVRSLFPTKHFPFPDWFIQVKYLNQSACCRYCGIKFLYAKECQLLLK